MARSGGGAAGSLAASLITTVPPVPPAPPVPPVGVVDPPAPPVTSPSASGSFWLRTATCDGPQASTRRTTKPTRHAHAWVLPGGAMRGIILNQGNCDTRGVSVDLKTDSLAGISPA